MSTPVEITNLISAISPENIEKFCRLKFGDYGFERCRTGSGGYFGVKCSVDKANPNHARALRQFSDVLRDGVVKVIGRVFGSTPDAIPMLVYSVPMKGSITSRSSKGKQAEFAKYVLNEAIDYIAKYNPGWSTRYHTGLFFFHDEEGNFRLSLIFTTEKRFRRFTYFVEKDSTGTKNRSFRYRMTNSANDKAASGEVERWKSFHDVERAFSVEELTKEFYKELFAWYERAVASPEVIFPCETAKPKEGENEDVFRARVKSEQVIRLITRLLFVWFIKQKNLVPNDLFDRWRLEEILKSFELTKGDNYYRAILQNLFFATLNSEIDCRAFAADGSRDENREHFDIKTLYRYSGDFAIPKDEVLKLFCSIPFLNGGLFECLDRGRDYFDGFSRNKDKVAHVPNAFFFADDEKAPGLIPLLQRYNFTIDENAHDDQDIALDPELLGKVFENLLGAFNPETSTTARNATGSFYTPREIVNYMVDESLIAYLQTKLQPNDGDQAEAQRAEHEKLLRELFADGVRPADEALCHRLDAALTSAKILDPACGSGAFPMGMLLRMVELLRILRQIPAGESLYDLKLQLIENCIYGVDIQCIAVQISKLRFFISLVCEQTRSDDTATNYGINPLPNLETKFVAADSLIGLPDMKTELPGFDTANIGQLKTELWDIRHRHFQARTYREKKKLRQEDEAKRQEIKAAITQAIAPNLEKLTLLEAERAKVADPNWQVRDKPQDNNYLITDLAPEVKENTPNKYDANARKRKLLDADIATEKKKQSTPATLIDAMTRQLTDWNPYDQNASSPYFDPEWMFNVNNGFDVVIGNPPYGAEIDSDAKQQVEVSNSLDSSEYFIYKFLYYLKQHSIISFIVPKSIVFSKKWRFSRNVILDNTLVAISDPGLMFENVNLETFIFVLRKKHLTKNNIVKRSYFDPIKKCTPNKTLCSLLPLPQDTMRQSDAFILSCLSDQSINIIDKIKLRNHYLGDIKRQVFRGIYVSDNDKARLLHKGNYNFINKVPDVSRYAVKKIYKIDLSDKKYDDKIKHNSIDRIIIKVLRGNRLVCTYIDKCLLATEKLVNLVIKDSNFSPKFIAGCLNSTFCSWYIQKTLFSDITETARVMDDHYLSKCPIPAILYEEQQPIISLVDRILTAKEANPSADTSELEAKIDQKVYELYGLTPEEIAIVEAATAKVPADADKKGGKGTDQARSAATDDDADDAPGAPTVAPAAEPAGASSVAQTAEPPATAEPKRRGRPPRRQQPTAPPAASTSKRGDHQAPGTPVTDI
ncbi:Eco57I restriction-modification methylase domain-containing protein [Oligosphaera ethanolica]|uniref:site-specific DNA-methyltransferase (adenine-specific) n=1 Tax=Oligosphaera ethanolica TaxID=760260 RepID=A0AAE4AM68_9BACT|nr:N-6 DNA methylase [Oligosphaera ethanolica]MDQ0288161.1 putative RNA methylase [Oligosphaera ethanolica]